MKKPALFLMIQAIELREEIERVRGLERSLIKIEEEHTFKRTKITTVIFIVTAVMFSLMSILVFGYQ